MKSAGTFYNALLVIGGVIFALLVSEATLRLFSTGGYYVWPPNLEKVFKPSPVVMPGITEESRFIINESGIRGGSFSVTDRYRVLAFGGSTTECLYLDQSETWPDLLQGMLNEQFEHSPVWVGNVGKSGNNTRHHIIQIEKLLDDHPSIDLVILLVGVNDLLMRLKRDKDYLPLSEEMPGYRQKLLNEAFSVRPGWDATHPFYKRTEIWRTLYKLKQRFLETREELPVQDEVGSTYIKWRNHRQSAAQIRDTLPDLSASLKEYAYNINAIIDLVQERNAQVVLMTQPTMWNSDLPEALAKLLWTGGIGPYQEEAGHEYYSVNALEEGMRKYNASLLQICKERAIPCLDLAATLPKDDSVFYDDVHFNESGARQVADILAQYLLRSGLLRLQNVAGGSKL